MVSDSKKIQTIINRVAANIQNMRNDMDDIKTIRDLYVAANVDPAGTPLEGNVSTLNAAINALDTQLQGTVFNALIAAVVPSHRGQAL